MPRYRDILVGLALLAAVCATLGFQGYGRGGRAPLTSATGAATISAADRELYTFTNPVHRGRVHNHPDSGSDLYVRYNYSDDDTSTTNWDAVLEPGDAVNSPDGVLIATIEVYSTGAVTFDTDFVVKGWR